MTLDQIRQQASAPAQKTPDYGARVATVQNKAVQDIGKTYQAAPASLSDAWKNYTDSLKTSNPAEQVLHAFTLLGNVAGTVAGTTGSVAVDAFKAAIAPLTQMQTPEGDTIGQRFSQPVIQKAQGAAKWLTDVHPEVIKALENIAPKDAETRKQIGNALNVLGLTGLGKAASAEVPAFTAAKDALVTSVKDTATGVVDTAKATAEAAAKAKTAVAEAPGKVASKAADLILGTPAKDIGKPDVAATFKTYGIEPPVSAVTSSPVVKGAEAYLQGSAWLGGADITKIVDKARTAIGDVVASLKRNIEPGTLRTEGVTPGSVGEDLKKSFTDIVDNFNKVKSELYDQAEKSIGNQQASLDNTRKALTETVAQLRQSAVPTSKSEAAFFEKILNNLSTAQKRTFTNIKQTRTDIGKMIARAQRGLPVEGADVGRLKRLYGALSSDIEATIGQSGQPAARALGIANAYYKAGQQQLNSLIGRVIKNSRNPELLVGKIVKPNDPTAVEELKKLVGEQTFTRVAQLFTNNILDAATVQLTGKLDARKLASVLAKYGDSTIKGVVGEKGLSQFKELLRDVVANDIIEKSTNAEGKVLPARLAHAIGSFDKKTLEQVFSPEELKKIADAQKMAEAMAKGTKLVEGSPTMEKLAPFGLNFIVGASGGLGALMAKIGVEYGASKLFTSPWGRKLLTAGKIGGDVAPKVDAAAAAAKGSVKPVPSFSYSESRVPPVAPPTVPHGTTGNVIPTPKGKWTRLH